MRNRLRGICCMMKVEDERIAEGMTYTHTESTTEIVQCHPWARVSGVIHLLLRVNVKLRVLLVNSCLAL
jgi:hypothetical protein